MDGHILPVEPAGSPQHRSGFRETIYGVVVEVGMGDQRQVALYLGELTGEPVKILLVPVGVGNYPNAAGRLPQEGTVTIVGQGQMLFVHIDW